MGKQFEITFCKNERICYVDRMNAGVNGHEKFPGKYKAAVDFDEEYLNVRLLLDVSQSELFINEGEVVKTNLLYPEELYQVKLFTLDGDLEIAKSYIYEMDENVVC